jgi:hypothetical protein
LRTLLHPLHLEALRKYVRTLQERGVLAAISAERERSGDAPPRLIVCGGPVIRYFHEKLTPLIRRILGEDVYPNYGCFVHYPAGSSLPRHRDFGHCNWAMSVAIDHTPGASSLCFELRTEARRVDIEMQTGDAVLYCGGELIHFRDPLPPGHSATPLILCFAKKNSGLLSY